VGTDGTFTSFYSSKNFSPGFPPTLRSQPRTLSTGSHSAIVTSALAFHRLDIRSSSQPEGVAAISKAKT
jgi:hypothetical protein